MTLQERGRLGNEAMRQKAAQRAASLQAELARGGSLKRAAWVIGMPYRTAKRLKWRVV